MTFKLHKEYCTGCQSGLFCDEGIALLQNKTIPGETTEKYIVVDSITEMAEKLSDDIKSKYVEVDDHKIVKVKVEKTEAERRLTKKQRWRLYKKKIKIDPNTVGTEANKFHRN